ncbi:hypothetical protein [Spirosoma fluviale]|uniref:Uncharacterized protein n=1 Tax=Spirosoma fluviale TaxID=1597977 RepID=A0A286GW59_9BACT|nr:hypothetical protein [Spirosoma fluviale]SOD99732.1 hypothetical protein SAMN06269250_0134 [Spirosoma fluviale]
MKYILSLLILVFASRGQSQSPLSNQELADFQIRARTRIEELESYISTIADKDLSFDERNQAITNALKLFTRNATIQVSRTSNPSSIKNSDGPVSQPIPIATYFQRLKNLPYSQVKVTNFNAARVDDWVLQKDGSYQATGYYFQNFKAWRRINGRLIPVVNHLDKKKIDVDLRMRDDPEFKEKHWMVLFENISVSATGKAAAQ